MNARGAVVEAFRAGPDTEVWVYHWLGFLEYMRGHWSIDRIGREQVAAGIVAGSR